MPRHRRKSGALKAEKMWRAWRRSIGCPVRRSRGRRMPMPIKVKKKGGVACLEGLAKTLKPRKRR